MKPVYFLIFICCIVCAGANSISIDGTHEPMRIFEGTELVLVCRYTGATTGGALEFYYQYGPGTRTKLESNVDEGLKIEASPGITTLTKKMVELSDGGSYRCVHTSTNQAFQTDVQVIRVSDGDATLPVEVPSSIVLACIPEFNRTSNNDSYRMVWSKNGTALDSSKHQWNLTHLTIQNPDRNSDIGIYNCTFIFTYDNNRVNTSVNLFSAPYIDTDHAEKSKNFKKEEDLTIDCPVVGFPIPVCKWFKDGNELDLTDQNDRYSFSDTGTAVNGRLKIYSLEFEDKGTYKCIAESAMFNSTELSILVRVKDPLEALWPFLGILAEVIVLVIIILIAEKRKRSQRDDTIDSGDGATEPIANATYHGGDDVRHRNVRA